MDFFSIFIHSIKIDQIKEQNIKLIRHKHQSQLYFDVFHDEMEHHIKNISNVHSNIRKFKNFLQKDLTVLKMPKKNPI